MNKKEYFIKQEPQHHFVSINEVIAPLEKRIAALEVKIESLLATAQIHFNDVEAPVLNTK